MESHNFDVILITAAEVIGDMCVAFLILIGEWKAINNEVSLISSLSGRRDKRCLVWCPDAVLSGPSQRRCIKEFDVFTMMFAYCSEADAEGCHFCTQLIPYQTIPNITCNYIRLSILLSFYVNLELWILLPFYF